MSNIIAIDPGLTGAVCVLYYTGDIIRFYDTPILQVKTGKKIRNEYNTAEMATILRRYSLDPDTVVVLEKIHSMPGQGVRSMFSMGEGFGLWKGICAGLKLRLELVTPQAWKKEMMADMGKEKDASRLKALQLFPQCAEDLKLKKHHGRADALLLAEYYRRKMNVR